MRIDKITGFALQLFLLVSCAGGPVEGYVPQEEYDDLKQEYSQLKESSSATRDQFVQQAEAMDKILQDLARISGSTVVLRSDVEKGTARLTQVEQIENRLVDIKTKLDGLDNLTKQNATYRKVITSLRKVIEEKEQEIESLKGEIRRRDQTISEQNETITRQSGTISSQNETITSQQEKLRMAVAEQAQLLFQAGVDFENLGDGSPVVRRRRDKERVMDLTREMYEKSILYYTKAMETGYPEAQYRISAVQEKIAQLTESK
ncbi:MAG: hypothetical protein K5910_01395 [Bacteroidales bacterium]|jgi:DNA repair exonuclease SbcCD ATPase subunit|nr:hypothetical protein [Bacteroidales bacterium]MBR6933671.1 hypothetical protein [Bacteroidales bacterium]MCR4859299.1 hypothetical protein [Bacteroidales bacterium]